MLAQLMNVSKVIPDGLSKKEILSNINLTIEENDIVAIVGSSGSGKSALLRTLSCLEVLESGEYFFNNSQIVHLPESGLANIRRKYIGFIGFEPEFIEYMTVKECLRMPLFSSELSEREQKNLMLDLLELIKLKGYLNTPLKSLTYYERICVSAARAFIKKPLLVVADDPCKKLHSEEALAFLDILGMLAHEFEGALVYSTYEANYRKIAKHSIYIKNGKISKKMEVS